MPCRDALIAHVVPLNEDCTFDEALNILDAHNIRSAPVVSDAGHYLGMFSLKTTFKTLLPIAVSMEGGLNNVDFVIGASPGMAKKLKKIGPRRIGDHLDTSVVVAHMETPLLEAMRLMVKQGSPLPVIDRQSGQLIGLVSEQSVLSMFRHLQGIVANRSENLSAEEIVLLKEFGVL